MLSDEHAYQTTSAELTVRIQMRDTILLALVGAAATVIGILVPLDASRQRSAIVIPFVTFIGTIMIFHHDWIILLNARFLQELERKATSNGTFWHTHRHYRQALFARLFFNIAHFLSIVLISIVSLLMAGESPPPKRETEWQAWWCAAIVVSVVSLILSMWTGLRRISFARTIPIVKQTGTP